MRGSPRARLLAGVVGCGLAGGLPQGVERPAVQPQTSGVSVVLQAVSAPSARVAWVTGHGGVVLRTTDGGHTWLRRAVAAADSLQFRDVHAHDSASAWILAAGPGDRSRIYHTTDGGATWTLQFRNTTVQAFFDCFAFWDAERGLAFSDAVAGRFVLMETRDGGAHWLATPDEALPAAQPGEGAFAASGTCVVTVAGDYAWIATGAADTARVLRTSDGGRTWAAVSVPIPGGAFAGLTTLAFRDSLTGMALGGDLGDSTVATPNAAVTEDGGRTWRAAGRTGFAGAAYGAAFVPGTSAVVAVGPGGMAWSPDRGASWVPLDSASYWSVGFAPAGRTGWAVGPGGRIVRLTAP